MNLRRFVTTLIVVGLLAGALSSIGCNTWEGAGRDVQDAGEAMEGD